MGVPRYTASVPAHEHHAAPLRVLVNIPGKKKSLGKLFADPPAFTKILNCSVVGLTVQGQAKLCGRCCAGFALSLAAFACEKPDCFGEGLAVKLHHKVDGIAALAPTVTKPLVFTEGKAVVFLPAVFSSAPCQRFALRLQKGSKVGLIRPVDLRLGIGHGKHLISASGSICKRRVHVRTAYRGSPRTPAGISSPQWAESPAPATVRSAGR